MWKLLAISTVLVLAKAANIQDFYGSWALLVDYPESEHSKPICVDILFEKSPVEVSSPCTDGRSMTLVKITTKLAGNDTVEPRSANLRILAVDTFAEVEPAFQVSCVDGEDRGVVRFLDNNYFIFYQKAEPNLNYAQVFAKTVVSQAKLLSDLEAFEELKGKKGNVLCSSETYKQ